MPIWFVTDLFSRYLFVCMFFFQCNTKAQLIEQFSAKKLDFSVKRKRPNDL